MFLANNKPLLKAFKDGDKKAMEEIYIHYVPGVTRFLRKGFTFRSGTRHLFFRGLPDESDLQGAVQEVFRRAFEDKARHSYNGINSFSNWVRHLLRLIPSLAELVMLGKIWYHGQQRQLGQPRFDVIVLDASATGHVLAMLRTPASVARVVPAGAMRENAALIDSMLKDQERTCLHVVTTPEEMPVYEAGVLAQQTLDHLDMHLGALIINQVVSPVPSDGLLWTQNMAVNDPAMAHAAKVLTSRERRRQFGAQYLERLPAHLLNNAIYLPYMSDHPFGRQAIERLSRVFDVKLDVEHTR